MMKNYSLLLKEDYNMIIVLKNKNYIVQDYILVLLLLKNNQIKENSLKIILMILRLNYKKSLHKRKLWFYKKNRFRKKNKLNMLL